MVARPRPQRRGPRQPIPVTWGPADGVRWRAEPGGRGYSSPVVLGDRVFLTAADDQTSAQGVQCFDAATGAAVWSTKVYEGGLAPIHKKNSHASSTPATDGRRVYAAFLTVRDGAKEVAAAALDLNGAVVWRRSLGPFENVEGYGAAVCLDRGLLFVGGDSSADGGFLAAVDTADGAVRWKVRRNGKVSYASPVVAAVAGRRQLLYHGGGQLVSYDPDTGAELWQTTNLPEYCANTPSFDRDTVYVSGGSTRREVLAVRADGAGDVTATHTRWRKSRGGAYVPSMLVSGGRLYVGGDSGVIACLSAADGRARWEERVGAGLRPPPPRSATSSCGRTRPARSTFSATPTSTTRSPRTTWTTASWPA